MTSIDRSPSSVPSFCRPVQSSHCEPRRPDTDRCEPRRFDNDRCEDRFENNERGSKCGRRDEDSRFECGPRRSETRCEDKRSEHGRRGASRGPEGHQTADRRG